jgi:predicted TIM-barrel fold metal-dependent hydrolase
VLGEIKVLFDDFSDDNGPATDGVWCSCARLPACSNHRPASRSSPPRWQCRRSDGVDAEIIYGVLCTASKLNDTEASNEVLRIYSDWLKDSCSHYPNRQIGLACLPNGSVEQAVKEVHRVAKMGLKGLELSCSWDMEPMWHPSWEPFWQAVDEVQLPLHFRTFPTTPPRARQEAPNVRRADVYRRLGIPDGAHPHHRRMMGAGVFERYPGQRVVVWRERRRWKSGMGARADEKPDRLPRIR